MNDNPGSVSSLLPPLVRTRFSSHSSAILEPARTFARASDVSMFALQLFARKATTVAVCQVVKEIPRDFKGAVKPRIYLVLSSYFGVPRASPPRSDEIWKEARTRSFSSIPICPPLLIVPVSLFSPSLGFLCRFSFRCNGGKGRRSGAFHGYRGGFSLGPAN